MPHLGEINALMAGSARPGDRAVGDLADRQYGVVAHRQLIGLGFSHHAIQHRLDAGRLRAIHVGVYAVGHSVLSAHGHWLAAVLACGPEALLSHQSAAALWGFRATQASRVHVATHERRHRARPGIVIHRPRSLVATDRDRRDEIPVTSVARTLLDLAVSLSVTELRRAFGNAERRELLDMYAIEELLTRVRGHRGLKHLRRVVAELVPAANTRSELEERFLDLVRAAALPRPLVNVHVAGLEVDAAWLKQRLVVELDGYAHHRGREAFERDHTRELTLAGAGYERLRFTWLMVERDPDSVIALVRSKLERSPASPALGELNRL
jgi:very-short-patch-repair endonuclease